MARGKSGRIVLEIDPEMKRELYLTLEKNQQTMKEWFLKEANNLIYNISDKEINNTTDSKKI